MELYNIYIEDENGEKNIKIKPSKKEDQDGFDCVFAAEKYAQNIGLKTGYEVR